jgi:ABC-type molybdate transport system substrate-binding protein
MAHRQTLAHRLIVRSAAVCTFKGEMKMLLRKLVPGSLTTIIPLLCFCASAQADDIKVLASVALKAALDDLAPVYEKKPRTS